jgi:hypothetical protein
MQSTVFLCSSYLSVCALSVYDETSVSTHLDKGKVVPVINHYAMSGRGVMFPQFLTSILDGSEWSVSRPGRVTPEKRAHGSH